MTGRVELLTGHPVDVQEQVNRDLLACLRGPLALERALHDRPADQLDACYRALLARGWQDRAAREALAREKARAVTARHEARHVAEGGNR